MAPFVDRTLATRLERTEGAINAAFVETHARISPDSGAAFRDVAGTFLLFDGVESPLTQTFGLGLAERVPAGELSGMEAFFRSRGAPVCHEVSPLAGIEIFAMLAQRGYEPIEWTSVLVQEIGEPPPHPSPAITVRQALPEEGEIWIATAVAGWSEYGVSSAPVDGIARVSFASPGTLSFFAFHEGKPIATASLGVVDGVALLAGASTVPEKRGLGAQRALLAARLAEAKRRGCKLAMMGAEPGSTSQRNAERHGFRVGYTRMKWRLAPDAG